MKQNITKEQWDELPAKYKRFKVPKHWAISFDGPVGISYPNIGQLIEFLGDDWWEYIEADYYNKSDFELCDSLWEAVKHKLKN